MRTPTNKVCFIVAAGYFKARWKFVARKFHQADIEFIARQIGLDHQDVCVRSYSKETFSRHQRLILRYFGCAPFDEVAKAFIAKELAMMVRVHIRPKMVLLEIIEQLTNKKIAIPNYAILANLIVEAINSYQRELGQIINAHLTETQRNKLDSLLIKPVKNSTDDSRRYSLTLLKKPFQSTQPSK